MILIALTLLEFVACLSQQPYLQIDELLPRAPAADGTSQMRVRKQDGDRHFSLDYDVKHASDVLFLDLLPVSLTCSDDHEELTVRFERETDVVVIPVGHIVSGGRHLCETEETVRIGLFFN